MPTYSGTARQLRTQALLLLLLITAFCIPLRAQRFDPVQTPHWLVSLDGLWRFHPGDNAEWAQPQFDDSSWSLLRSDRDWSTQGFNAYSGMGWYRFRVTLPPGATDISLLLPHVFTSYEIHANGDLVARFGKMPPHALPYATHAPQFYRLPPAAIPTRDLTIAIRVWHWPAWSRYFGGGPAESGSFIGDSQSITEQHKLFIGTQHWDDSGVFLTSFLQSIGALIALCLFLLRRSEREYLWFAAILACSAAAGWIWYSYRFVIWPVWLANQLRDLLIISGISLAQFAFFTQLFKPRKRFAYWFVLVCFLLPLTTGWIDTGNRIGVLPWNLSTSLLILPLHIWIISLLAVRAWHNYLDARVLFIPVLLQSTAILLQRLAVITFVLDWQHRWGFQVALLSWPFPITLTQAGDLLFLAAVLAILVRRFTRSRAEEERYGSEFAAARAVQQYLIPERLPRTPSLAIHAEYRPAREVGGDFFQVIPREDASTLIVIGDVEGKGMHAGMLAALIIGAVRTAAEFTSDPARILTLLNDGLLGRGIATCLALHIDAQGNVSAANAGHPPPYLNGSEVQIQGSFPLGISRTSEPALASWCLVPEDELLLITDGVVEAQDPHGELFGFDRLRQLLEHRASPGLLADTTQAFGQQDDITVLSISRPAECRPLAREITEHSPIPVHN